MKIEPLFNINDRVRYREEVDDIGTVRLYSEEGASLNWPAGRRKFFYYVEWDSGDRADWYTAEQLQLEPTE